MEFILAHLWASAIRARIEQENTHKHNGEYDQNYSPEAFLITEEEWAKVASLPRDRH